MMNSEEKYVFSLNGQVLENGESNYLLIIPELYGINKQIIMDSFKSGKLMRNCRYIKVGDFSEGLARVINTKEEYGFIDKTGKEVIACQFPDANDFHEGLACVKGPNGLYGYIDVTGNVVIPFQFAKARDFSEGLAPASFGYYYGFIDKTGKMVIPEQYVDVGNFKENRAWVKNNNSRYGYIDKEGKEIVPCKLTDASDFNEGLACVRGENYRVGYMDYDGNMAIECQYDNGRNFSDGLAWVKFDKNITGFINKSNKTVLYWTIPNMRVGDFHEGRAWVQPPLSAYGFIDKKGIYITDCQYQDVRDFRGGRAWINKWGLGGYLNHSGQEFIEPQYSIVGTPSESAYTGNRSFNEGLAWVLDKNHYFKYIDVNNNTIIDLLEPQYVSDTLQRLEFLSSAQSSTATVAYNYSSHTIHIVDSWQKIGQPTIDENTNNSGDTPKQLIKTSQS